jgi:outer membrane protein assembly factor BamB
MAGLPTVPGKDMGKPLDPAKVAEQAQHLPLAAQIALPATLSATMSQERALSEMDDPSLPKTGTGFEHTTITMLPTKDGVVEFAVKLVESRFVEVSAMKPPPAKSILEGNLTAGQSLEAASEILNEMQRARGGDTVREDQSRYQVTIRHLGTPDTWTGEVIGKPSLYPLQTVNVLAANKMIRVLDKNYKQLWTSPLNYNVEGRVSLDEDTATYGRGPCVEHKGQLYVFDQGVLTCFDMSKGSVRWRLISVGITGMFFDDKDMIYVNTTSASPDSIKYSRQIDVSKQVHPVVQKVDSTTGKVLWTESPGGLVNYVSGKFIFTVQMTRPSAYEDEEEGSPYGIVHTGFDSHAYLRIRRINPKTGRQLWEHFQERGPLDVGIEKNTIRLVFKKEVQVLKFLSF